MNKLYKIENLKIKSVIRVKSGCEAGKSIYYPPVCPTCELIYFLSGNSLVKFQNKTENDLPGKIRFLPQNAPNDIYRVDNIESGECVDIYFTCETSLPKEMLCADFSNAKNLQAKFINIYRIWNSKVSGYYNKCISIFYSILAEMEESTSIAKSGPHYKKILPAINYIHEHYIETDFSYSLLAELCNVSYTYFRRLFIEIYRLTPQDYIKQLRIKRACELLLLNRFSITDIAEMSGFSDVYYFSRMFKSVIGVSPSKYINQ